MESRTICISNLTPSTTLTTLLNQIPFKVEFVKLLNKNAISLCYISLTSNTQARKLLAYFSKNWHSFQQNMSSPHATYTLIESHDYLKQKTYQYIIDGASRAIKLQFQYTAGDWLRKSVSKPYSDAGSGDIQYSESPDNKHPIVDDRQDNTVGNTLGKCKTGLNDSSAAIASDAEINDGEGLKINTGDTSIDENNRVSNTIELMHALKIDDAPQNSLKNNIDTNKHGVHININNENEKPYEVVNKNNNKNESWSGVLSRHYNDSIIKDNSIDVNDKNNANPVESTDLIAHEKLNNNSRDRDGLSKNLQFHDEVELGELPKIRSKNNDIVEGSNLTSPVNTIPTLSNPAAEVFKPRPSPLDLSNSPVFKDSLLDQLDVSVDTTDSAPISASSPISSATSSGKIYDEVLVITRDDDTLDQEFVDFSTTSDNSQTPIIFIRNLLINLLNVDNDIEHFRLSINKNCGSAKIHFTSIDSAIKVYEYYSRKIYEEKDQGIVEEINGEGFAIRFTKVSFTKDRCDKSSLTKQISKLSLNKISKKPISHDVLNLNLDGLGEEVISPPDSPLLSETSSSNQRPYDDSFEYGPYNTSFNNSFTSFQSFGYNQGSYTSTPPHQFAPYPYPMHRHSSGYLPSNSFSSFSTPHQDFNQSGANAAANAAFAAANAAANAAAAAAAAAANYQGNPDPYNNNNRTICLGNLHPQTTVEEIANNIRAGGLVELINHLPHNRVCFITFIDPMVAYKFHLDHQILHQVVIHGSDVTVKWGSNHSGSLSREISLAVTAGASRNVYIGVKLPKDNNVSPNLPSEAELRADFGQFGELEQINFFHNKDCGFLNFLNIVDAITVVEIFEMDEEPGKENLAQLIPDSNAFYNKYSSFKISFAKDRCGNPPKFSFKKRIASAPGSTYQQYQHQLHGSVNKRKIRKELYDQYNDETRLSQHQSFMEDTINEEAAMVFGIISNEKAEQQKRSNDQEVDDKSAIGSLSSKDIEDNSDPSNTNNIRDKAEVKAQISLNEADDEDDNVSIIIDSDESNIKQNSGGITQEDTRKESRNTSRKVYQSRYNSSDPFIPLRRRSSNSSHVSLGQYSQESNNYNASPYIPHQQPFFQQPPKPQSYRHNSFSGPGSAYSSADYLPGSGHGGIPSSPGFQNMYNRGGYFPPPSPYSQTQHMPQSPTHGYFTHRPHGRSSVSSTSGSQVMAQYLAKSQQENLLYAASILQNDEELDERSSYEQNYMDYYRRNESTGTLETSRYRRSKR